MTNVVSTVLMQKWPEYDRLTNKVLTRLELHARQEVAHYSCFDTLLSCGLQADFKEISCGYSVGFQAGEWTVVLSGSLL